MLFRGTVCGARVDEILALYGGFDSKEFLGEKGMCVERVEGMGSTESVLEFPHAVCELVDLFVEVLGGGEDESGCAK